MFCCQLDIIFNSVFFALQLHCRPRVADNGMAAWRSGGFPALPFKSARPAAVAPNRSLSAGILPRCCQFHNFVGLHFVVDTVLNSTTLSACIPLSIRYSTPLLCRVTFHCRYSTQFQHIVGLHSIVGMVFNSATLSACTSLSVRYSILPLCRLTLRCQLLSCIIFRDFNSFSYS